MRTVTLVLFAVFVLAAGCAPVVAGGPVERGTATYVNMLPPSGPAFSGTYDFDLLQPVVGEACVGWNDNANYWAFSTSGGVGEGFGLKPKAEAAAVFNALSQVSEADLIVVTRASFEMKAGGQMCATIYGRAARLKKGGEPEAPASAAPTYSAPAAGAAAPKPSSPPAASAAPATGSSGASSCYRDTDCPGALVCRDHVCVTSK